MSHPQSQPSHVFDPMPDAERASFDARYLEQLRARDGLPELSTRLERAARRYPRQQLAIAGAGAFPSPARAKVLWVGIRADTPRTLASLAASVAAGARRAGAPPPDEGRKYSPHLTLARCRQPANVTALTVALAGFSTASWTAESVHLVRSYLGSGPPQYEDVGEWPLVADARSEE